MRRRRVLVVTPDTLTARMAGPAIRAWHIAADLATEHQVTLLSTQACTMPAGAFEALAATSPAQVTASRSCVKLELSSRPWNLRNSF